MKSRPSKPLRMERSGTPENLSAESTEAAKESVAAHQAACGCHEIVGDAETERNAGGEKCLMCARTVKPDARDNRGHLWHLDPLCKVRPEAVGR